LQSAGNHFEEGRLACAVSPNKAHDLASADLQRDISYRKALLMQPAIEEKLCQSVKRASIMTITLEDSIKTDCGLLRQSIMLKRV
jgi:hypothetical protein